MAWQDLLQKPDETLTLPWVGGSRVVSGSRSFRLLRNGPPLREHGWYQFVIDGRTATVIGLGEPNERDWMADAPHVELAHGYLVGDRIVPDGAKVDPEPARIAGQAERVHLLPEGLDRFSRVRAMRVGEESPLVFMEEEMPLGPEDAVLGAYLDRKESVDDIPGVTPALDAAFRMECFRRAEVERRRRELEEERRREEERRAQEERRRQIREQLGDGAGRREVAKTDFETAARAALTVGGAEYLDHRNVGRRREVAVRFRFDGRRFECTCDRETLRIIDSGICLTDHDTGEKGDAYFTLESLPSVIREAGGDLVVYRHV